MAIFKNNKKFSSLTRPAFFLPKSHKKTYSTLDEDESSCISTITRKQAQNVELTTNARPRVVTFEVEASVREIVRAKDLSEDPNELWYSAIEYKRISQKALSIVRAVDKGNHQAEGKRLCARGLERYLATSKTTTTALRHEAWSAVFEEQSMQLATGEKYDDERISSFYKKLTTSHMWRLTIEH